MWDFQFILFLFTGLLLADALLVDIVVTINQLAYIKLYLGLGSFSYSPLPMELEGTSAVTAFALYCRPYRNLL